jgi:hypothetical protein
VRIIVTGKLTERFAYSRMDQARRKVATLMRRNEAFVIIDETTKKPLDAAAFLAEDTNVK